ncbi:aldose epimerase family protein [Hungatella hathewayi]
MKVRKTVWNGKEGYLLQNESMEVFVNPADGMNIYQIDWEGRHMIDWEEARYQRKATYGVPVLYPTPNRSENLKIQAYGKQYDARMHGLVKNLPFQVKTAETDGQAALVIGVLEWNEEQPDFVMFPFPSTLSITVKALPDEVVWSYQVDNRGEGELSYGIAIHPYFSKREQEVKISVPAASVMEMTEEKIPTGKLIPAGETVPDLRTPVLVDGLSLDHVYTDCPAGAYAEIFYKDCKVKLEATEEFGHIVVFTPDAPFFCVENQSCSTDCFNLFAKGYARESGLQAVHAGQKKSGEVRFVFEKQE